MPKNHPSGTNATVRKTVPHLVIREESFAKRKLGPYVFLEKSDWKYEKSSAGDTGGGRTHTFGVKNAAKKLTDKAIYRQSGCDHSRRQADSPQWARRLAIGRQAVCREANAPNGTAIGKALATFAGESGIIRLLVVLQ